MAVNEKWAAKRVIRNAGETKELKGPDDEQGYTAMADKGVSNKRRRTNTDSVEKMRLPLRYVAERREGAKAARGKAKYVLNREFQVLGRGAHGDAVVRAFDAEREMHQVAIKTFAVDRACANASMGRRHECNDDLVGCTGGDECACYCFYRELWSLLQLQRNVDREDIRARSLPLLHDSLAPPCVVKPYIVLDADYSRAIAEAQKERKYSDEWTIDAEVCDLHKYIQLLPQRRMEDKQRVERIGQLLEDAITLMHGQGVIHRDIKPGNVLLVRIVATKTSGEQELCDEWPVLIDFSSSNLFIQEKSGEYGVSSSQERGKSSNGDGCQDYTALTSGVSTLVCRAPEMLMGLPYGPAVDLWGLGTVLYYCLEGKYLFPYMSSEEEILTEMCNGRFGEVPEYMQEHKLKQTGVQTARDGGLNTTLHRLLSLDPQGRFFK